MAAHVPQSNEKEEIDSKQTSFGYSTKFIQ